MNRLGRAMGHCLAAIVGIFAGTVLVVRPFSPFTARPSMVKSDRAGARTPASVAREPNFSESFNRIDLILNQYYYASTPTSFRRDEKFIESHSSGTGAPAPTWMEGGYYPMLLGNFSYREASWGRFLEKVRVEIESRNLQRKNPAMGLDSWSKFCALLPVRCAKLMHEACVDTRNFPGDTPAKKILTVLSRRGLPTFGLELREKPKCAEDYHWWSGRCDLSPKAMAWFNTPPMARIIEGVSLGNAEYEVIAMLLTSLIPFEKSFESIGTPGQMQAFADDVNPASVVYTLANSLGTHPGKFFIGIEDNASREVWNYLVTAYTWKLGEPAKGSAMALWYRRAIRTRAFSEPDAAIAYLRPIEITLELNGDPNHLSAASGFLEFNASGELIGGEWMDAIHPDYLWAFPQKYPEDLLSPTVARETQAFLKSLLKK